MTMSPRHDGSYAVDRLNRLTRHIDGLRTHAKEVGFPFAIVEIEGEFHHFPVYDGTGMNIVRKLASLLHNLNYLCTLRNDGTLLFEEIESDERT